jgi:transposase, IS30 family
MSYQQLTLDERYQIAALRKQGLCPAAIARAIGRNRSTVTRELTRNAWRRADQNSVGYHPVYAQHLARKRRVTKGFASRKVQGALRRLVESKLHQSWSPEQIAGRLWTERKVRISHETIYQHVLRDSFERKGTLRYCLRFAGYKHHRLKKSVNATNRRANKHHISERPAAANTRREIGHWERDCLVGSEDAALLTVVDRKTRYSRIRLLSRLNTGEAAIATADALKNLPIRSITNDDGHEFQQYVELQARLGTRIYFCDPSSPWQRGSIENLNGLLRQFVPKRSDIGRLPGWAPRALEDTLNHRPRKVLGYRTPHEVFFRTSMELMKPAMHFGLKFNAQT